MGPCGRVSVGRSDFRVKSLGLCSPLAYSQLAGVLLPGWWLRHEGVADSPEVRQRDEPKLDYFLFAVTTNIVLIYLRMRNKPHSMEEETRHVLHHIDLADPKSSRCVR